MSTTELEDKMRTFTGNLENKFNAASADITSSLRDAAPTKILGLD